jgi:hypothetical protein
MHAHGEDVILSFVVIAILIALCFSSCESKQKLEIYDSENRVLPRTGELNYD